MGVTDKLVLHVFKRIDQSTAWLSILPLPEALANDEVGLSFKNNFRRVEVTLRKPIPSKYLHLKLSECNYNSCAKSVLNYDTS